MEEDWLLDETEEVVTKEGEEKNSEVFSESQLRKIERQKTESSYECSKCCSRGFDEKTKKLEEA